MVKQPSEHSIQVSKDGESTVSDWRRVLSDSCCVGSCAQAVVDLLKTEGTATTSEQDTDNIDPVVIDDEEDDVDTCFEEVTSFKKAQLRVLGSTRKVFVLRSEWTTAKFQRMFNEQKRGFFARLVDGHLHVFERSSRVHGCLAAGIMNFLGRNTKYYKFIRSYGRADIVFGRHVLQPDQSIYIEAPWEPNKHHSDRGPPGDVDSNGSGLPKVVVEVSVLEPLCSIGAVPSMYLRPDKPDGIRGVLVVICRPSDDAAVQKDQLVAIWYEFGHWDPVTRQPVPSFAISFGSRLHRRTQLAIQRTCGVTNDMWRGVGVDGPPCDRPDLPEYQLPIPVHTVLWHGFSVEERTAMGVTDLEVLTMDLYEMKGHTNPW